MRTIIAERKRPRTDNDQTISPESAYAPCNPGRHHVKPGLTRTYPYQALQARFQPLSPFAGSSVSFLVEFFTITTSPTSEPS